MTRTVVALVALVLLAQAAPAGPARADRAGDEARVKGELGVSEAELAQRIRSGRLSADEAVARGEELSFWARLRLWWYSRELAPYFEGVEEAFRDLARSDPGDAAAVAQGRDRVATALARARGRLMSAGREAPEDDWRRGILGLLFLDQDWRHRVAEQGKSEITNPYDLVALVDCIDARLRGLDSAPEGPCPVRPAP